MKEKSNSITIMAIKLGLINIKAKRGNKTPTHTTDTVELEEAMSKREMATERETGETTQLNMPKEMMTT